MSGGEIVGDIAQGALTARAFEPKHGEAADGHTHESACLNCGTALVGSHCHACGQAAHVHKTLGAFFHDLLHGVFHFEGKVWRTLPLLAWRPGQLTREYIDGRRASYVSPIALFLFSVFLMFATIHALAPGFNGSGMTPSVAVALSESRTQLAELEAKRKDAAAKGQDTAKLDKRVASAKEDVTTLENFQKNGVTTVPLAVGKEAITTSIGALDEIIGKARSNPDLVLYKLQTSAYKYSWLLIPLSVPFVWLLFPFSRRYGLYDHIVFVTYSLCFMTLLVVVLSAAGWLGVSFVGALAVFIPPWHLYRQLRGTYVLSRFGAIWRASVLLIVCTITLILFGIAIVGLGLTG